MPRLSLPSRNSTVFLVAILAVPTTLIVGAGVALVFWLLGASAVSLDTTQRAAEARLARTVIASIEKSLYKIVSDYANWDDMYDYFNAAPDPQWEKENLGPYALDAHESDHFIVVAKNGRVVYNFARTGGARATVPPADAKMLADLTALAFANDCPGEACGVSGIVEYNGAPYIAAISTIHVSAHDRVVRGDPSKVAMIQMRALDAKLMTAFAHDYGLRSAGIARNAPPTGVALQTPWGKPSPFSFAWTPSGAGSAYSAAVKPWIVVFGATVLLMFLALAFVWSKIIGQIRASEARAESAEDTNVAKSAFIANMSHELRTPLNAIIGFSEFITGEILGPLNQPKYREYAQDILNSGHHLLRVVNDILLVSKIDAGKHALEVQTVALDETVAGIARMFAAEAAQRNVALTVVPFDAPLLASANEQAVRQILINVIANALKFSPAHERVTLAHGRTPDGRVEIEICDRGCGMPAATLRRLGKPFVQAESAYARKHHGTGLGLSISFALAKAMHGAIEVQSVENAGTKVTLRLPPAAEQPAQTNAVGKAA